MAPQSPDPGGPSNTSCKSSNQNNGGPRCRKGFEKSPAPQGSCCGGCHLRPPSQGVAPPKDNGTISIASRAEFGISGKWGTLLGRKYGHMSPGLPLDTLHWKLPPGAPLSLGLLICTSQPSWARGSAASLWTLPGTTSARTARSVPRPAGLQGRQPESSILVQVNNKEFKRGRMAG